MSTQPIYMDPNAPGKVIWYALLLEVTFNIAGGTMVLFRPIPCLNRLVDSPVAITTASKCLMQWLGAMVYALTVPLLLCMRSTREGVDSRPTVYATLLAGETFLTLTMLRQLHSGSGLGPKGLTRKALMTCCAVLAVPAAWRLYVLFVAPEWFGRYIQ